MYQNTTHNKLIFKAIQYLLPIIPIHQDSHGKRGNAEWKNKIQEKQSFFTAFLFCTYTKLYYICKRKRIHQNGQLFLLRKIKSYPKK